MMTAGSKGDCENNGGCYQSPTEETLTPISSSSTTPSLPLDLVTEILCWIPVKFLLQFCCVCKSWNYLISQDSEFQKKQLSHGRLHLIITPTPSYSGRSFGGVSSRHGIFCFGIDELSALLFNPSVRKFKLLPPLENPQQNHYIQTDYTLMYHRFTDNYKIVAVSMAKNGQINVHTHTLGTNYWTRIQSIPFHCYFRGVGISVSNTVDWLVYDVGNSLWLILSLDLEDHSYQKLLHPLSNERCHSNLVYQELKGCLCIISQRRNYSHVWIMKEHGNAESWTKLLSVPYMTDPGFYGYSKALYVSEDDRVLMEFLKSGKFSLVIYDFKNDTFNIPKIQNINDGPMIPNIYVESLISPFSQY